MADRCEYEQLPITSVKTRPGKPDELVIPAEPFREWAGIGHGVSNSSEGRILRGVCDYCGLCKPRIEIKSKEYRIFRTNYRPLSEGRARDPFYEVGYIIGSHDSNSKGNRVTIIDDIDPRLTGDSLNSLGHTVMCVRINPDREPTRLVSRQLVEEILKFMPQVMIVDKGLGWWDGIEIILNTGRASEGKIRTIMYTGEWQTDETRRVADRFLQKPASIDAIESAIRSLLR